jgi:1,4-dihydroxy-6-naphthoate synthase
MSARNMSARDISAGGAAAQPLSLAISPCPNDTFTCRAWVHGLVPGAPAVEVTYADIDVLNGMAERGSHDVVKVSYAALPWLLEDYQLLRAGSALGRGCGPLLLARPGEGAGLDVSRTTVAVPGLRTTAYLLFRLWAAEHGGVGEIVVLPFDQIMPAVRDGRVGAGLVIHESRFTYPYYGLQEWVDLGAWWEGTTGLAIPLGAIVARRSLDGGLLSDVLRASVEAAWAAPDDPGLSAYVAAHAAEMDPDVQRQHIALYVNGFSADLGDEGYAAVDGLLSRAAAAGLTPSVPLLIP